MAGYWVVVPCGLVQVHRRFRSACSLHNQGENYTENSNVYVTFGLNFFHIYGKNFTSQANFRKQNTPNT
jgi:hypothetical protein